MRQRAAPPFTRRARGRRVSAYNNQEAFACRRGSGATFTKGMRKPRSDSLTKVAREALSKAETYFANHLTRMDYAGWKARGLPIGSGVTEAACKTPIKQRLCQSGMRWRIKASNAFISLRAIYLTPSHWDQFWNLQRHPSTNFPLKIHHSGDAPDYIKPAECSWRRHIWLLQ